MIRQDAGIPLQCMPAVSWLQGFQIQTGTLPALHWLLDFEECEMQRAPVKTDESKFKTLGCGILFLVVAGGLVFLALRPFSGAVPQALDAWPRAWWMVTHFHDDDAFPAKANLCAAPYCRSTHVSKVYVGGNPGHMSESKLRFCNAHTPQLPKTKSRYDDALRFIYWMIAMGLSLLMALAAPFIVFGLLMLVEGRLKNSAAVSSSALVKVVRVLMALVVLVVAAVMLAWVAAWVMFAYW